MSKDRPNILLLHTDQQRFDTIAGWGASHVLTPGRDGRGRDGTTFRCAYSSNPVCMPARHDLLTGASARHHGYWRNGPRPIRTHRLATVPRLLTEAGYQTVALGKMHYYPPREHHGFAHMELMEELPACREDDAYLQYLDRVGYGHVRCQHGVRPLFHFTPQASRVPPRHHGTAWVGHRTEQWLRAGRDRPVFIFASWIAPHPPFYVPESFLDMYRDRDLPAPCGAGESPVRQTPALPARNDGRILKRIREAYCAAITHVDEQVGRILDVLEETGQLEETLIIFTSDHGEMLGDRGNYLKRVPYEGSAHIPLIVRGPGFAANTACDTAVTTWDIAATILETAGVHVPSDHPLAGRPLGELVTDTHRIALFHHGRDRERYIAACDGRFKFMHWYNGGDEELYDLHHDPWEQHNLAAAHDSANPLRRACIAFEEEHGQAERVRNGEMVDLPFETPDPYRFSRYPWGSPQQFPVWTDGYDPDDLEAIRRELLEAAGSEAAHICGDPAWREHARQCWQAIAKDATLYDRLFERFPGDSE